jgi:hypothetical protein
MSTYFFLDSNTAKVLKWLPVIIVLNEQLIQI